MWMPRPIIPVPKLEELIPPLEAMGLPAPAKVSVIGPAWVHQNYRLSFPMRTGVPELMLRRLVAFPGHETLRHESAALAVARTVPNLPVVNRFEIVPDGVFPWRAAISDILPGVQGGTVHRQVPELRPVLAQTLGAFMARLAAHRVQRFGTRVDGDVFRPRRATWEEEWRSRVFALVERARSGGIWMGAKSDRLLDQICDQLGALSEVKQWALVHYDLHASNFLFSHATPGREPPVCTGLVDWEGAFLGDPLAEWASLMERSPSFIAQVVRGFGPEAVAAMLEDPVAVARIEVYARTRILHRLAFCTSALFLGEQGIRRGIALELARMQLVERIQVGHVLAKLQQALKEIDSAIVERIPPASHTHVLVWRALEAMRFHPSPKYRPWSLLGPIHF